VGEITKDYYTPLLLLESIIPMKVSDQMYPIYAGLQLCNMLISILDQNNQITNSAALKAHLSAVLKIIDEIKPIELIIKIRRLQFYINLNLNHLKKARMLLEEAELLSEYLPTSRNDLIQDKKKFAEYHIDMQDWNTPKKILEDVLLYQTHEIIY
jgi:hypothetical protein